MDEATLFRVNVEAMSALQGVAGIETQITTWGTPLVPGEFVTRHTPLKFFMEAWLSNAAAGQVPQAPLLLY